MAVEFVEANSEDVLGGSDSSLDNVWDGGGSLAVWIRFDATPSSGSVRAITDRQSVSNGWQFEIENVSGTLRIQFRSYWSGSTPVWYATPTVNTGVWYHVVITYNADSTGNDAVIYWNGASQSVTESAAPSGTRTSDTGITIALMRRSAGTFQSGALDDVRLFSDALTAEEVSVLYAGYRGPLGQEVLWYDMATAWAIGHWDGTALTQNVNKLPDRSLNSNVGNPRQTPTARASDAPRYGVMF